MRFLAGVFATLTALIAYHVFMPKFWDWFWRTELERTAPRPAREWTPRHLAS